MTKAFHSRYYQIIVVIIVLTVILMGRLFVLTVVENSQWESYATEISAKKIYTSGPRGEILDRYGRVIAGNMQSFSVSFDASDLSNDEINEIAIKTINIIDGNGDAYYDNFPIIYENGSFVFTYQQSIEEWLAENDLPLDYTAEQAFEELRKRYEIEEGLSKYDAQSKMQTVYNFYPPISVKNMKYTYELEKESFIGKFYLGVDQEDMPKMSAEEVFDALCEKYKIDKDSYSVEDRRKILVVRDEIASLGYSKYKPVSIATNVSDKTIITIEENSSSLKGVQVVSDSVRYYPNGNTASHILGYIGKISETEKAKYVDELGYNPNDMIGIAGIESACESVLKGQDGVKVIQVNATGEFVKLISEEEPKKGDTVYLTIDLELQKIAEEALKQGLDKMRTAGWFESEFGNYKYGKAYQHANAGAVVAIEVETGDVLAMASYPDYDPNLFSTGISDEDWKSLQKTNLRDSLAPAPLYNIAARTAVQPGSTFKPVTATAAMGEGLDPSRQLYDGGYIQVGNRPYGCSIWHSRGGSHGSLNLQRALEMSCNYYFYDVATGKDFYTGKSLGYDMTIDTLMEYAKQYGLGLPTGIQIKETITSVPSAEKKMANTKNSLKNVLVWNSDTYFKPEVVRDDTLLNDYASEIVSWAEENPSRNEIIKRLPNYGVKDDQIEKVADLCKFSYFNQAQWTLGDELNIAIGQGENAYTPLQMANYVATIGNGGYHNQVSLIKAIEGRGHYKKGEGNQVNITEENLHEIVEGMKRVTKGSAGTLRGVFGNFPVEVAAKTGTAEKSGVIQPADEVVYIQEHLKQLNGNLTWEQVETEMVRLMTEMPERYSNRNLAVDQAVINLSNGTINQARINAWKPEYDNFAWVIAMAPADDPKIAVAALAFQGGSSGNVAPIVREVIGKYLQLDKQYEDMNLNTVSQ